MPTIKVVNMAGAEVGSMELSNVLFGAENVNGNVLHAAVRAYLLNQRQGTQSVLLSGHTAVSLLVLSPEATAQASTRRPRDLLSSAHSPISSTTVSSSL